MQDGYRLNDGKIKQKNHGKIGTKRGRYNLVKSIYNLRKFNKSIGHLKATETATGVYRYNYFHLSINA